MLKLLKVINKALDRELKKLEIKIPNLTRAQEKKLKKRLGFPR